MKKVSKYIMILSLMALFIQPIEAAAEESITVALAAGAFYGISFGQDYLPLTRIAEENELKLQQNPDKYKVTNESLTRLIQQEAEKRGLDFSKFVVIKNMETVGDEISVIAPPGAKKYTFHVGSDEYLKKFSEMDTDVQQAVVQHEFNHVLYNHAAKRLGVMAMSHYIGFLAGYAGLSLATHYTANYIEKNSYADSSIASWIRTARPFMSAGFGFYIGDYLSEKCSPVFSRYCEKQADLAVDDKPAVIKGLITFCQSIHDRAAIKFGQACIEHKQQHPEQAFPSDTDLMKLAENHVTKYPEKFFSQNHPAPLERVAYLKEKLQQCSNDKA